MIKVFIDGYTKADTKPKFSSDSFLLRLLEISTKQKIEVIEDIKKSDLILLYPFLSRKTKLKIKLSKELSRDRKFNLFFSGKGKFSKVLNYPHDNIIAVAHENLDSRWWGWFRDFIVEHKIPRLTFWPESLDPLGARFPYWWNYADFPEIDLDTKIYSRYGKKIRISSLLKPFQPHLSGMDKICFLQRHMIFPRDYQIESLKKIKTVDTFMHPDNPWLGTKAELLNKYNYVFCAENSSGYGYETEKLPEAWNSGCFPMGYIKNPLGDFNDEIFLDSILHQEKILARPLLVKEPNLSSLKKYLYDTLNK